jgi:hypothetical protein
LWRVALLQLLQHLLLRCCALRLQDTHGMTQHTTLSAKKQSNAYIMLILHATVQPACAV